MGLDWNPGNKAKPGYETDYARLSKAIEAAESDAQREALREQFFAISISAYETLGAPRVGFDQAADAWARARYRDNPSMAASETELLSGLKGFYVVELVPTCDGVPPYSNGTTGGYVEPFSFRGQFLTDCVPVIGERLLEEAHTTKPAPALAAYANELLACGRRYAEKHGCSWVETVRDDWDRIGDSQAGDPHALAHIVVWAAKWCSFWSARGHLLDAWSSHRGCGERFASRKDCRRAPSRRFSLAACGWCSTSGGWPVSGSS